MSEIQSFLFSTTMTCDQADLPKLLTDHLVEEFAVAVANRNYYGLPDLLGQTERFTRQWAEAREAENAHVNLRVTHLEVTFYSKPNQRGDVIRSLVVI